ncbi:hypothetical protein V6Z11_A12G032900 [Gossypium hirsutum]
MMLRLLSLTPTPGTFFEHGEEIMTIQVYMKYKYIHTQVQVTICMLQQVKQTTADTFRYRIFVLNTYLGMETNVLVQIFMNISHTHVEKHIFISELLLTET